MYFGEIKFTKHNFLETVIIFISFHQETNTILWNLFLQLCKWNSHNKTCDSEVCVWRQNTTFWLDNNDRCQSNSTWYCNIFARQQVFWYRRPPCSFNIFHELNEFCGYPKCPRGGFTQLNDYQNLKFSRRNLDWTMSLETLLEAAEYLEWRNKPKTRGKWSTWLNNLPYKIMQR